MLLEMLVPSPGESISEVEIAEWLVEDGEYVEKDQSIAEIDSDKATLELPAEESGIIKLLVDNGDIVAVGEVVCTIDTTVEKESKKNKEPNIENDNKIQEEIKESSNQTQTNEHKKEHHINATPLASSMISQHNISIDKIKGQNADKKLRKMDVEEILHQESLRSSSVKKMSSLRRKISKRLVAVKNETAMLTTFNEVDMTAISDIRKEYKNKFKDKYGVNLGYMSFFTKAVTAAILDFPDVNSMIDGDNIIQYNYADIGIAVSAPKGLMVPVLRNAELMKFSEIELEIKRLAEKAREGKITIDEMLGGTFTITNGGVFGSMLATPIINPPQSAILGMHNIVDRPVVIEGEIKIRPIMFIALSYDHRIIDGRESVGFLCRVKECLENPKKHLMNDKMKEALDL